MMRLARVMEKILIVGSGITGALTASLIRREIPKATNVVVWDKANKAGGRMNTSYCPKDPKCIVDLGAQYISATPENYSSHKRFYEELESNQVLAPLSGVIEGDVFNTEGAKHFVAPSGISSVVNYFLGKSGAEVKFGHNVGDVSMVDGTWKVTTVEGTEDTFDAVVLTMPGPQLLQLKGTIHNIIDSQLDVKTNLEAVVYSSRYAMGLYYEPVTSINLPWCAKYFTGDDCVRFVAIDNKKRGQESADIGASVAVHTSVPFGLKHLEEDKDIVCTSIILPRVHQLLPQLPTPVMTKNHKWRYSQVYKGFEGRPGALLLQKDPLLVVGGDTFTQSGFDGCIESATTLTRIITSYFQDLTEDN